MRTVPFQSVYEGVLQRHGLDPVADTIPQDTQRAIAKNATWRIKYALDIWDWPEFSRTEERAFRTVWNDTRSFRRVGEEGRPDEFYFLGAPSPGSSDDFGLGYYKVKTDATGDPPASTLPTDTTYFEPLTNPEPYVDRQQTCKRTLGTVLGVYKANPSLNGCNGSNALSFRPSERGILASGDFGNTVFLWYLIAPPEYTMKPYIAGKTYQQGDLVFYAPPSGDGNCYRALLTNNANLPTNIDFWTLEPVPAALADFIEAGAYADCLRESINGEPATTAAMQASGLAETEAQGCLQREIDKLIAQGQKHFYGGARYWRWTGLWSSQPWGGDRVIELTDVCEQDGFPPGPAGIGSPWEFHPEIVSLIGPSFSLQQLNTMGRVSGSMVEIVIGPSGDRQRSTWQILPGLADPLDGGQISPSDYNLATNDVHWEKVG